MKSFLKSIGELRIMLLSATLLSLSAIPFTDTDVRMDGWGLFPDVLVPVVSFILLFILFLDMLMSRVFMIEADGEKRQRFSRIFWLELIQVVLLISLWSSYFIAVLS
ncbi:MAG: hypothetical protein KAT25_02400 [Sulfuriflexus sp.]|nr:hypothetical protein [Sulfuriflexus sp.]